LKKETRDYDKESRGWLSRKLMGSRNVTRGLSSAGFTTFGAAAGVWGASESDQFTGAGDLRRDAAPDGDDVVEGLQLVRATSY
jgi:hypothetical protein